MSAIEEIVRGLEVDMDTPVSAMDRLLLITADPELTELSADDAQWLLDHLQGAVGAYRELERDLDKWKHSNDEHARVADEHAARAAAAAARVRDLEERLAKAAEALEPFNQAALAIRTAERMNRREFQDGDTFVSGVAWKEDDKVRTITFGDFRRARTALSQIRSEK